MDVKVVVWGGEGENRAPIVVDVVKTNKKSMWVRLPDGKIIKRKRGKHY